MKFLRAYPASRLASPLLAALGTVWLFLTPPLLAGEAAGEQRTFASADAAITGLREAVKANDQTALNEIFGPDLKKLLTGDAVQDTNNFQKFSAAITEKCESKREGENRIILEIGSEGWAFPIPLVKMEGQWYFDTFAGQDEIINRHIGRDELNAIGVCEAFVEAQRKYFEQDPEGSGTRHYAARFKSTPGKKDGLFWESSGSANASPFADIVAEARAEGYGQQKDQAGARHPYHGYFFNILTRQGSAAPGGRKNYLAGGQLTGGFALIAYPDRWDKSGIMTFIVGPDGKIYQRSLGKGTVASASAITEYNPDRKWTLVADKGIVEK